MNLAERGGVQLELPHHLRTVRPSRYDAESALHEQHTAVLLTDARRLCRSPHDRALSVGRLAVVGGHSLLGTNYAASADASHVVLQRHGPPDRRSVAHLVDHVANMRSLVAQGCDRVLAISSVGVAADRVSGVGTVLVPDDFIGLGSSTRFTSFADERGHSVSWVRPGLAVPRESETHGGWRRGTPNRSTTAAQTGRSPGRDSRRRQRCDSPRHVCRCGGHDRLPANAAAMPVKPEIAYAAACIVDNLANGLDRLPRRPSRRSKSGNKGQRTACDAHRHPRTGPPRPRHMTVPVDRHET